jgi:hypothetical protein
MYVAIAKHGAASLLDERSEVSIIAGFRSSVSIVGLWHAQYTVGGNLIQDAYQIWNAGGTEVHIPNLAPRQV